MSKLNELIAELCPNGVEYKKLKEVATISRGGSFQKKDYEESGFPCIHYGQIYTLYGLFVEETASFIGDIVAAKQKKAVTNDIIMAVTRENIEDVCKCVAWLGEGEVAVSGHTAIIHHTLNPKYLVYYLHSSMFYSQKVKLAHGTKVIEVKPDSLGEIKLPVPPLEVQREIVRVLDNFTFLTAELTAELTARRKQYEFYRNRLLTFKNERIDYLTTKDIKIDSFWLMPATPKYYDTGVPYITSKNIKNGMIDFTDVKYISEADYQVISSKRNIETGDLLITMIGTIGEAAFVRDAKKFYGQNIYLVRLDTTKVNKKYYYYYLTSPSVKNSLIAKKNASSQGYIKAGGIENLEIPIPKLEIQNKIVEILDRFDSLCNDISIGLPAEIAARQKQYEYYRDKLLSFKELNA